VIKLKDMLSENVWDRKFGEPLPTLSSVIEQHNDCGCNGITSCACESVTEGPDERVKAQKEVQQIVKSEAKLRARMLKLEQIFLKDARPENVKLSKDLTKSYKENVTTFMKDVFKLTKKVK
jgi:hypothetical protein|tara:strand:+ start:440 stop:802 length:363 start_codon:yes stop_codon:yes gene_type:complete